MGRGVLGTGCRHSGCPATVQSPPKARLPGSGGQGAPKPPAPGAGRTGGEKYSRKTKRGPEEHSRGDGGEPSAWLLVPQVSGWAAARSKFTSFQRWGMAAFI